MGPGDICRVKRFSGQCNLNVTRPDGECSQNSVYSPDSLARGGGELPYKGLMGTCGQPGYVFRDFCLKQGIEFIIFGLNQGIDLSIFVLHRMSFLGR